MFYLMVCSSHKYKRLNGVATWKCCCHRGSFNYPDWKAFIESTDRDLPVVQALALILALIYVGVI